MFKFDTENEHKPNSRSSKKREKSYDITDRRPSNSSSKNIGQFILGEKLGEGTFGVVRLGTHIITGEKVTDLTSFRLLLKF